MAGLSVKGGGKKKPPGVDALWGQATAIQGPRVNDTLPAASGKFKDCKRAHEYIRKLTHNSRTRQGASGLGSPRGATSVRRRLKLDENHRRQKLSPVRQKWERKATELNATIERTAWDAPEMPALKSRRKYAVARVAKLNGDILPRLDACGQESLPIVCGCGPVGAKKTCRQWWLCGECRARRSPQLGADIRRGLDAALAAEREKWGRDGGRGMEPQIRLLTLTAAHTGDLVADQASIAGGWRKLYKRMHDDYGESFPYVGVWEVTPGTDGLGHVHLHLAVVWRWRDFWRIREQWETACPTSRYLDIKKRKDGKASSPSSVGKYLGKYLSKGVDVNGFDERLRAEVSAAFYNQRSVLTSVRFWRRYKKCCHKCGLGFRLETETEREQRDVGTVLKWLRTDANPPPMPPWVQLEWTMEHAEPSAGLH